MANFLVFRLALSGQDAEKAKMEKTTCRSVVQLDQWYQHQFQHQLGCHYADLTYAFSQAKQILIKLKKTLIGVSCNKWLGIHCFCLSENFSSVPHLQVEIKQT